MKKVIQLGVLVSAISVAAWGIVAANASDTPKTPRTAEASFKFRAGAMNIYKWYLSPMGAMVKGKMAFDAKLFAMNAQGLAAASKLDLIEGFPEDSSELEVEDSSASGDIWDNQEDFVSKYKAFQQEAEKLAEVAQSGDEAAMKAQFVKASKTCGGCHKPYRSQ